MVTRLWTSTDFLSNRASFGLSDRCRANLAQFFSLVYCCLAADEDDCGDCVLWNSDWILPSSLTMRSLLVSYFSICWFLLSLILFSDWKRCTTFAQSQTRSNWLRSTNKKTHTVRRYSVSVVCVVNFNTFVTHMNSAFIFFILVPLDKPEEFLLQIHKMDHFAERLECWLYNYKFTETITAIGKTCLFVKSLLSVGAMGDTLNRSRCVYDFLQCNTYSCLTQRFYPT